MANGKIQRTSSSVLSAQPFSLGRKLVKQLAELPYYIILGAWSVFTIFTFIWLIYSSFKNNQELFANVWKLPASLHWQNYNTAWVSAQMGTYFLNSVWVVGASIVLTIALSAPASYVLARRTFFGNTGIVTLFIMGMAIPHQLLLVPIFILLNNMHLINTLSGLILVYTAVSLPFTIFLLIGFYKTLPTELEESAAIDGASEFVTFIKIMFPLTLPGIITAAILNFITLWSEYMLALVLINDNAKRTLSLGVYNLKNTMTFTSDWVGMFAGVVILMIPSVIIFVALSEKITSGMTVGATKG
ncbi:carbohydrate ABC transporter permease [Paenibacillus solisilvae]|uniref:Carbohydrate ABC transporter permease n=1 Tax=Paenibacillus solisilvae TaxID=2486751 RepID=A0ABW0W8A1_9BACL